MKIFRKKTDLEKILKSQSQILEKLASIEKRLSLIERGQNDVKQGMAQSLVHTFILYGKSVLTRLNLIELSEGRPISVSENERAEIENSFSNNPNPKMFKLPRLAREFQPKNKNKLN